ncbi:MAG: hypothetical protein ACD_23C00861G0001 [uncultured bacterium]|nr:MAG: hypothetical protein ACD_23C00861G0001 [uncultured bacterium]
MWALNTTKRKFTQKPVAKITQSGAPAAIKGMAASCELPANTSKLMATASNVLMPDLTMATPVIRPQAARPGDTEAISRRPRANAGCCHQLRARACSRRISRAPAPSAGDSRAGTRHWRGVCHRGAAAR